jgi:hypothetical protein
MVEVRYKTGTGSNAELEVRVNGVSEATSNDGTLTTDFQKLTVRDPHGATGNAFIDDIFWRDHTGWVGAGQIEALRMDADSGDSGEDEWEDEAANATTYDAVNQDPLTEANYAIESSQADADHRQLWTLGTTTIGTINHVRIGIQAARGNGSATEHRIRSKVSTPENSADLGLDGTSRYYTFDPTTQPSNQSELDSYQTGVWRNSGGREFNCYEQWVMVDYTPAAVSNPRSFGFIQGI